MATEAEALPVAAAGTVEYVVQVKGIYQFGDITGVVAWRDLTTVAVSPRTKRRTVIERALAQAKDEIRGIEAQQPIQLRVLSPQDARPFKVSAVQRDPELRIEGV